MAYDLEIEGEGEYTLELEREPEEYTLEIENEAVVVKGGDAPTVSGALVFDDDGNVTGTIEDNIIGSKYGNFTVSFLTKFAKTVTLKKAKKVGNYGFSYCASLTSVDLPACTSVGDSGFSNCSSLTSIDLPACTSVGDSGFSNCKKLTSIDLPLCTSVGNHGFESCSQLTSVDLPACTSVGSFAFSYCSSLTSVDLPVCTYIAAQAFSPYVQALSTLVLRSETVVALGASNVFSSNSSGYYLVKVYVPDALVDSYKTATNWSTYADQIKPLSELPA